MTLFLRDDKDNTIVDLEVWVKKEDGNEFVDISCSIVISHYSKLLLSIEKHKQQQFIDTFDEISGLRGWLWEVYFMGGDNDPKEYKNVLNEVRQMLSAVANRYGLRVVED